MSDLSPTGVDRLRIRDCRSAGCDKPIQARGLCRSHYGKFNRRRLMLFEEVLEEFNATATTAAQRRSNREDAKVVAVERALEYMEDVFWQELQGPPICRWGHPGEDTEHEPDGPCEGEAKWLGWCKRHYYRDASRQRRNPVTSSEAPVEPPGDPLPVRRSPGRPKVVEKPLVANPLRVAALEKVLEVEVTVADRFLKLERRLGEIEETIELLKVQLTRLEQK